MGLNAVQQYVRDLIDGLATPAYPETLTAYIAPPVPGEMNGPVAYVWGATWTDERFTWSRGTGQVKRVYLLDVFLMCPDDPANPAADSAFPVLIDSVTAALRATPIAVTITDPDTGGVSQITSIGERFSADYAPVHGLEDQRWVLYQALLRCHIEELTQA